MQPGAQGLATGGRQRWSLYPNLPTFQEAGLTDFTATSWAAVGAPPGLPVAIVDKLNKAYTEAMLEPDARSRVEAAGFVVRAGKSEVFANDVRQEMARLRPVIDAANIKMDQ